MIKEYILKYKGIIMIVLGILVFIVIIFAAVKLVNSNKIAAPENTEQLVSGDKEILQEKDIQNKVNQADIAKQLNVTILLDLSDRIARITDWNGQKFDKGFVPLERDLSVINTIIDILKEDALKGSKSGAQKLIDLKSKIKFLCIPKPKDHQINFDKLKIDFSDKKYNGSNSKLILKNNLFNSLSNLTKQHKDSNGQETSGELNKIYNDILATNSFPGSDIWKFFEQYAKSYCIDKNYRNILVIFTDGYIYHEDSIYREGNRYSYLTSRLLNAYNLRAENLTREAIKQKIEQLDFGFITRTNGLNNLEVLIVEVLPDKKRKFDGYVIEEVLTKWLKEMGVTHSEILFSNEDSDLTASRIRDFFDDNPQNLN